MKKSLIFLTALLLITAPVVMARPDSVRKQERKARKEAEQSEIRNAIENGRFIIRLSRIHLRRGGFVDLVPRSNYIILDRGNAIINTAYLGRQYSARPVSGINMKGKAMSYELIDNKSHGGYIVSFKANNGYDTFNVNMRITRNGLCNVTLSGLRIENVSFSGNVVPVREKQPSRFHDSGII